MPEEIEEESFEVYVVDGYIYDPAGQITSWTQQQGGNPVKTLLPEYDLAGQLTGTAQTYGSSPTADLSWAYDLAGNRTQSGFNGVTTAYTNNTLNQLTQVSPETIHVQGLLNVSATVSVNGVTTTTRGTNNEFNVWTPATVGPQVLTITAQNGGVNAPLSQKYRVVNGQALQYDADGELINDGKFAYSWDAANRLIQITTLNPTANNPAHTSKFNYDGLDRMVEDQEFSGVDLQQDRHFIWNGSHVVEERDQHNNVVKRFYGEGVQVVSGVPTGNYSYLRDHLGSIREVLDTNGNAASVEDYDTWGNLTQTTGNFTPDFGYAGYFEHQSSGLAMALLRTYMPLTGRWLSRDPIGVQGGDNYYEYAANCPVNFIDIEAVA